MARDFFAVLWNPDIPTHVEGAARINAALAISCRHLSLVLPSTGLHFYASRADPAPATINILENGTGVVYGKLFKRTRLGAVYASPPSANFTAKEAACIVESGGRYLVDNYWGHYLAFLTDGVKQTKWVFRSPACHQPCLCAVYDGIRLYFSSVEDLANLGLMRLTINWDFVAAFSAFIRTSGPETGLNEIRELSTGEYLEVSPRTVRRGFHWNPGEIAKCPLDGNPAASRRLLRSTVLSCVFTWAGEHASILQRLSGGIDSSIATVCLGLAPNRPRVSCLNYHTRGTFGDEREYARAVCEAVGFPLVEYRQDGTAAMDSMLTHRRTESPAAYLTRDGSERREIELARQIGATARFTGIFGDALFHMPPAAATAADYIRARGVDGRFFEVALQAAQIDRVSIWRVLRGALMNGLLKRPRSFVPGDFNRSERSLLTRAALESVCQADLLRFVHPWLRDLRGVPSGKFPVIASLSWNSAYFNALSDPAEPDVVHPFFSEPLAELCLRLPTYSMLRDGWDRALVREAFASELPDLIRYRVSKGSANLHVRERIAHNARFIRALLAESVLVNQGILDPDRIAECLPGRATRSGAYPVNLWACVAAEAWTRAWSGRGTQVGRGLLPLH